MSDRGPVPAVVIGGFLGSGKTTLVNAILSGNHGLKAGVIVNDFGAVNIDADLVASIEQNTVALSNGCICCSIRGDLVAAVLQLLDRPDPPEVVFIEASGVSDPTEIARSLDLPALQPFLKIESQVSLIDAERLPSLLDGELGALVRAQIRLADLVIVNKIDLVAADQSERLWAAVRGIAPDARIFPTTNADVPLKLLTGSADNAHGWRTKCLLHDRVPFRLARGSGPAPHPQPAGPLPANSSDLHPFETWHWRSDTALSLTRLQHALENLPDTVYRAKGLVWLEELAPYRTVLQMVGWRYNLRDGKLWGTVQPCSEIVVIGKAGSIEAKALERHFAPTVGTGDENASPVLRLVRRIAPYLTAAPGEITP